MTTRNSRTKMRARKLEHEEDEDGEDDGDEDQDGKDEQIRPRTAIRMGRCLGSKGRMPGQVYRQPRQWYWHGCIGIVRKQSFRRRLRVRLGEVRLYCASQGLAPPSRVRL